MSNIITFDNILLENSQNLKMAEKGSSIVEVRTGSDSDFSKILELLSGLNKKQINWILRVQSAHRMGEDMMESAKAFPNVMISEYLSQDVKKVLEEKNFKVALCIACAGGSAHIAGMTASETQTPVIAYPVGSSSGGQIPAFYSMIDMPPGIPNGIQTDQRRIVDITGNLMTLRESGKNINVWIPENLRGDKAGISSEILKYSNLVNNSSYADLGIHEIRVDEKEPIGTIHYSGVDIVIPTLAEQEKFSTMGLITENTMGLPGLSMGRAIEGSINPINSLLFMAQLLHTINPSNTELLNFLVEYRKSLTNGARTADNFTLKKQLG